MIRIHAKPPRPKPPRPPQLNPLLSSLMSKVPAATPSPPPLRTLRGRLRPARRSRRVRSSN